MACPSPQGFAIGATDKGANRLLFICFLLTPSLTSVFKGGKQKLELSLQPTLGISEDPFSLQHRAWILTPILNSGMAGLSRASVSVQ